MAIERVFPEGEGGTKGTGEEEGVEGEEGAYFLLGEEGGAGEEYCFRFATRGG